MTARVVVVHDDPEFVDKAVAALVAAGHDAKGYTDTMSALRVMEATQRLDILITRVVFPAGQPHGVALALMTRAKMSSAQVLFTALPENQMHTEGLGPFLPLPVTAAEIVAAVGRMLEDRE